MVTLHELEEWMEKLDDWAIEGSSIMKEYSFKDFKSAIEFVNKVAEIADKKNHHPDIFISYKNVRLILRSHDIGGLAEKDFLLAEEIDKIKFNQ